MELFLNNETSTDMEVYENMLESVIMEALRVEKFSNNVEISVTFVDNEEIKALNSKFRNIDKETDVLSFPLLSNFELVDVNVLTAMGDIVISVDKIYSQSLDYGHTFERELAFLVAHSMFHLMGYDHMTDDEEKVMVEKQREVLNNLNITR